MAVAERNHMVRAVMVAAGLGVAVVAAGQTERFTLENGATVIVQPVPGIGWVGVESLYRAGIVHEPEGVPQAAHLVEHLACMGAMKGYALGAASARLNQMGMANAETLGHFTHFDAMVPGPNLGEVFRVEAGRLGGVKIDAPIIAQEAPRCYQEAAHVESSPQAPMFKFALMAANQAWRFGADRALVKGGLIEAPVETVARFYTDRYAPPNLTMVIVGDTTAADAKRIAGETIGGVARRESATLPAIDWAKAPRDATVLWDSTASAVIIAWPPPADDTERLALTLRGLLAMAPLSMDETLQKDARMVLGSSHLYPVGDMPLMVYATLAEGADAGAAGRIEARVRAILEKQPTAAEMTQLRTFIEQISEPPGLTEATVRQQATQVAKMMGVIEDRGIGMVVGQAALNIGVGEMLAPGRGAALEKVKGMSAEQVAAVVKKTVGAGTIVLRLEPEAKK
jgi:predicted Zn-dependent peptidase